MKKHVSLFLALFLILSVFSATTAAADLEQDQSNLPQDSICAVSLLEADAAPRVTDPDVSNCSDTLTTGYGDEITEACKHSYKYTSYNSTKHKKLCSKCGALSYEKHNFKIDMYNNGKHWYVCDKCGKSYSEAHTYKYLDLTNKPNQHKKYCTKCNYSVIENHQIKTKKNNALTHRVWCINCSYNHYLFHVFDYEIIGSYEYKTCKICGYQEKDYYVP